VGEHYFERPSLSLAPKDMAAESLEGNLAGGLGVAEWGVYTKAVFFECLG
jgi:hypothetical protein